jgi:UrcA family protein
MATHSTKNTVLAVCAAAGMLAAAAMRAEPATAVEVAQITVDYSDLDLGMAHGVQVLHSRLAAAAERVCPSSTGLVRIEVRQAARECREQALAKAVREIGNAELAAVHAATTTRG